MAAFTVLFIRILIDNTKLLLTYKYGMSKSYNKINHYTQYYNNTII